MTNIPNYCREIRPMFKRLWKYDLPILPWVDWNDWHPEEEEEELKKFFNNILAKKGLTDYYETVFDEIFIEI